MEPGEWVIFGEFKLKEWEFKKPFKTGETYVKHKCDVHMSIENLTMVEVINRIASHDCPLMADKCIGIGD